MAHEKVYGICEDKCRVEVYPKAQTYSKTETYAKSEVYAKGETYAKSETYNKTEVDNIATELGAIISDQAADIRQEMSDNYSNLDARLKALGG